MAAMKKIERPNPLDRQQSPALLGMGPVEKLQFLSRAAAVPTLSRVQLAVLIVLADMAGSKDGLAWPSFNTLAARTGTTPRHAKRAVQALVKDGAVVLAMPGTRVRSNRYRLNKAAFPEKYAEGSDTGDTTPGDDMTYTTVVTPSARSGGAQVPDVVACVSPESVLESEPKARMKGTDNEGAHAYAGGPGGPLRLAGQPGQDAYPEFWEAFGVRSTVAMAEKRLRELLAAGADYGEIVDGARRYHAYNLATGGNKRSSADRWLEREAWRDAWTVRARHVEADAPSKADSRASETRKQTGKGKPSARAKKPVDPGIEAARRECQELKRKYEKANDSHGRHIYGPRGDNGCRQCDEAQYGEGVEPCSEGARLDDLLKRAKADMEAAWDALKQLQQV